MSGPDCPNSPNHPLADEDLRAARVRDLRVGHLLRSSILGTDGILLLRQGSLLTEQAIRGLEQRGIGTVLVHREELAATFPVESKGALAEVPPARPGIQLHTQTTQSRRLDEIRARRAGKWNVAHASSHESTNHAAATVTPRGAVPYDTALVAKLRQSHERSVTDIRAYAGQLMGQARGEANSLARHVERYLEILASDLDLVAAYSGSTYPSHYPYRHGLHVALLCLAMGRRLGLAEAELRTLALGAMLNDVGMLGIPESLWRRQGSLTVAQRMTLMEHPLRSVELLANAPGVSDDVRLICYQVHERIGGQGYPRRSAKDEIHPHAQLIGLADVYVALVSDRPHRAAILPYKAMEAILKQASEGWFDPRLARVLLETLSLYPLGSHVFLNDGRRARILRSNGTSYDRPTVEILVRERQGLVSGEIVDLSRQGELEVARPVAARA